MNKYEFTPLMEYFFNAISRRNYSEIQKLFETYPDFQINSTDEFGNTLLHKTVSILDHNTYPLMQLLLSKGADPMAVNEDDINCFDIVKSFASKGDIALSILKTHKEQTNRQILDELNKSA